ncbi:hypothetical protein QTP86_011293, partial [Hemibagrus guttatus]
MENGRASGIDGLPAEFYKAFWAVIGQDMLDVLRDSIRRGELPLSCRRAVLTLLPKKGDLTHLKNCTDCKLLSKALASRLTKVMEQLIHQDQTYCVPDRSIFDKVYLIRDILDISRLLDLKTGLIFLDQEKAFDRVEHEYLWKVLEAFGSNPGFVAMIRVLYSEIESVLKILSSAKVNWTKSEAISVGEWGGGQPSLPGGLEWKRGGFKYLGVYLGTNEFLNKNWEGSVEHVKGRLSRWKRLVPKMSYRERHHVTLVINNLAASSLWHKLACIDPPPNLLANIQAQFVDFFWDGLHWIPQSVLHLPKEEGGQGLVQLSSRAAAFRLQFIQRLLTGPRVLIWNVFKKQNKGYRTVHWLLEEPLVYGGRLDISGVTVPALSRTLVSSGIVTLRELVNVTGSDLSRAEDLAARMGLRFLRVVNQLLHRWRSALTSEEHVQLMDYQRTETGPAEDEPFPRLNIAPDLDGCAGPLLECRSEGEMDFGSVSGKLLYRACVKVLNKKKLSGRVDTPWRSVLGFNGDIKPEWRALYKPPLTKTAADLQWRILHVDAGMVAAPAQGTPTLSLSVAGAGVYLSPVVGEQVGFDNILWSSRMKKAIIVFLKSESLVNQLSVDGIRVRGVHVTVTPLSAPATRITMSNVLPFFPNDAITKELNRFGKIASPVKMIPLGCKNAALKRMFLSSPEHTLGLSFHVFYEENSYMVYASTENLRCFECGDLGHKRFSCPHKNVNTDPHPPVSNTNINNTDHHTEDNEGEGSVQVNGATEEVKGQKEESENGVRVVDDEQPGRSFVSVNTEIVTVSNDKSEAQGSAE